jgi:WhiB family transcriptional regulator, redox-sensing transcriptional regulator
MAGQDWRDWAACAGSDPELFFPAPGASVAVTQAKAICGRCPVAVQCRAFADSVRDQHAVWAGRSARQLRDGRGRPAARCGTRGGYMHHRRLNEKPCEACRDAHRAYNRERERAIRRAS